MPHRGWIGAAVQATGAVALIVALAFTPSRGGDLLLIPLGTHVALAREAVDRGALIVDRGPGATLVVRGELAMFDVPLLRRGVLTLGAPTLICGQRA